MLHNYLKPRSHILVEPRQDIYLQYLKHLLDVPGSRYILRDWDDHIPWQTEPYFTDGLLPDLQNSENSVPEPTGRNDSLLIIANMSSLHNKSNTLSSSGHDSHRKLLAFANAVSAGSGFHAHGPVRMLMWVTEKEKQNILPRTVSHRKRASLYWEMYCHIEEIVTGSQPVREKIGSREDFLNVASSQQVAERMRRQNLQIPEGRRDETQRKVQESLQGDIRDDAVTVANAGCISPSISREWHKELRQLRAGFESGKLSQFIGGAPGLETTERKRRGDSRHFTPEWMRLVEMERTVKSQERRKNDVGTLVNQQEELDALELDAYREGLDEVERQEKLHELEQHSRDFKAQLAKLNVARRKQFNFLLDDRRAFAQNPPLLMWDHRSAEPLVARDDEFYRPKELALLDIQPRFPNPFPMTIAQEAYFRVITGTLFSYGSQTPACLKQLAPGAMEALVSRVPALQDPRKGGRRSLEDLRSRVMTGEMAHGLALAWDKWAFKPLLNDELWGRDTKRKTL